MKNSFQVRHIFEVFVWGSLYLLELFSKSLQDLNPEMYSTTGLSTNPLVSLLIAGMFMLFRVHENLSKYKNNHSLAFKNGNLGL